MATWQRYSAMVLPAMQSREGRASALRLLRHLPNILRLYWRLFRDRRVSLLPKALLVGALLYVIMPFDLVPDAVPVLGEIDDLVVVLAAARWFIDWCPPAVVREHVDIIAGRRPA